MARPLREELIFSGFPKYLDGWVCYPEVPLVRPLRVDGEELLVVGVAGQPHRQDVQVGLTDPRHLEMNNDLDKFMAAGGCKGKEGGNGRD